MNLEITSRDGPVPVLQLRGRVDTNTSHDLEEALQARLSTAHDGLILDFTEVEYISSAGLRVVLMTVKKLDSHRGGLVLCGMSAHVREVFDIAGFSRMLDIQADQSAALQKLGVKETSVGDPAAVLGQWLNARPITCKPIPRERAQAVAGVLGIALSEVVDAPAVASATESKSASQEPDNPLLRLFERARTTITALIARWRDRP